MVERVTSSGALPLFLSDQPELVALANLAGLAPSRVAEAFNDPLSLFAILSLEELQRLQGACERLGSLTTALAAVMDVWLDGAKAALQAAPSAD
jgi:hypothetical protein